MQHLKKSKIEFEKLNNEINIGKKKANKFIIEELTKEIIKNGNKLSANMSRLYSANYKPIRPLSKNSYINNCA